MTKFAGNCGFVHIFTEVILNRKLHFLSSVSSYFEAFELKVNCNNFRSIWFHLQSEVILIYLYSEKETNIECSFLLYKEHRSTTSVRVEKLKTQCSLRNTFPYRNYCLKTSLVIYVGFWYDM